MRRTSAVVPEATSREKLIRSAEHLFADRGFDGVSVRDIAGDAGVNSALVGYYFGGKEGLLAEVYTRHCEPLKQERLRMLEESASGRRAARLEQVLYAFVRPSLDANEGSEKGRSFSRLRAMLSAENSALLEQLVAENFDETSRIFVDALGKCLPKLSREDVLWRFHFLLGAIYYSAAGPNRIRTLSRGKCDPTDPEAATDELVRYAAAGFRANANRGRPPKGAAKAASNKQANGTSRA